jgi:hypothetical protein
LGARGSRSGKHLLYAVSEEAKYVSVYHYAAELREENPKVVEAETLKGILLAVVEFTANEGRIAIVADRKRAYKFKIIWVYPALFH